jgi:hypothetical protein
MTSEHTFRAILATLLIVFAWFFAADALARGSSPLGPDWLWTEKAPNSAAAARAFSEGDLGRGLRLSKTALKVAESRHERFILHHNMCIAYSAQGLPRKAARHCQQSRFLAASNFMVIDTDEHAPAKEVLDRNLRTIGYAHSGE